MQAPTAPHAACAHNRQRRGRGGARRPGKRCAGAAARSTVHGGARCLPPRVDPPAHPRPAIAHTVRLGDRRAGPIARPPITRSVPCRTSCAASSPPQPILLHTLAQRAGPATSCSTGRSPRHTGQAPRRRQTLHPQGRTPTPKAPGAPTPRKSKARSLWPAPQATPATWAGALTPPGACPRWPWSRTRR